VVRTSGPDRQSLAAGADALPLPLIAGYLNRYGLSADAVRITSCDTRSGAGVPARDTWIGLTFSAVANLAALQARSARIPLQQTAESAARRLGDELREIGWETTAAGPDTVPELFADGAREVWSGLTDDGGDHLAAYRVDVDDALADTLAGIWAAGVAETWTAVEFAGTAGHRTVAAACALRTEERPVTAGPLPGLNAENGNHRSALQALWPLSARRLEGHAEAPDNVTGTLRWPAGAPGPRSVSRHAAVS
jgi:type VII secretion protein EccE